MKKTISESDRKNAKLRAKKLSRLLFGRTTIVILAVILQIYFLLFASVRYLHEYSELTYEFVRLLSAIAVIHIINEDTNTSFKLVWVVPILIAPVFGTILYFYVNVQIETKHTRKRLASINKQFSAMVKQNNAALMDLSNESNGEVGLAKYLYLTGGFPVFEGDACQYFPMGKDKFAEMRRQLERAEKFIFLEYFIISDGEMWSSILDILKRKVSEGVEVRLLYDGMNSLVSLPYDFSKKMAKYGIKARPFNQIRPVFSTIQNNRDHRKILIIDGNTAFTGGINLADEYINKLDRFGVWKDTAVMVKGHSVKSFTLMFLKMWHEAMKKDIVPYTDLDKFYYNVDCDNPYSIYDWDNSLLYTGGFLIPYADNPFGKERIGKRVYIDILNRACKYVHIMTPYLILDDEMMAALRYCCSRGVETTIIMPHIPDKKYAYYLARTYYADLISRGVHIYEYQPGFVHAKIFVSDDRRATVGSINLDYRSLYLHFEDGLYLYQNESVQKIEEDFKETLGQCLEITLDDCKNYSKIKSFIGGTLKLFAPLM